MSQWEADSDNWAYRRIGQVTCYVAPLGDQFEWDVSFVTPDGDPGTNIDAGLAGSVLEAKAIVESVLKSKGLI